MINDTLVDAVGKQTFIVKANGKKEAFDPEKLRSSLLRSGADEADAETVVSNVVKDLKDGMTTTEIYGRAFAHLRQLGKPAAIKYSLRRAIMELGPTGFPFEDFIAEILRTKGYETLTGQEVMGVCVPHEVDVVAWNEEKLIMCEAKFHNELGIKSDLKVALYVKARFDDLKGNTFDYGRQRKLDEGWLVTNTKFSSTAIHYGVCNNLTMIGWNYPEKGNLEDLILEGGLHPITCLTTLTLDEKRNLASRGVVLCSTVKNDPSILTDILGSSFESTEVLEEINKL